MDDADMRPAPSEEPVPPSVAGGVHLSEGERGPLLIQMWAEYFRHLSTMGVAGSAGLLILLEVEVLDAETLFWVALGVVVAGAVLALQGSRMVLEFLEEGGGDTKRLKVVAGLSSFLQGAGAGILAAGLFMQ